MSNSVIEKEKTNDCRNNINCCNRMNCYYCTSKDVNPHRDPFFDFNMGILYMEYSILKSIKKNEDIDVEQYF
jgi:hypothetical protein